MIDLTALITVLAHIAHWENVAFAAPVVLIVVWLSVQTLRNARNFDAGAR
jgi:hypothetical protein